ncbi:SMI1/KNR4 family protein [Gallibacterium anatis]|uniref:SMI1/KNR4 family protein n=1 Tax=Gallibacterium anatis TaxID=750 RepID=UPI0039FC6934
MTSSEFFIYLEKKMNDYPNLFLFRELEPKATIENIKEIESYLKAKLPSIYVEFQKTFGGGGFGFTELFSVVPDSEYYVLGIQSNINIIDNGFFPIFDDQTGGVYCFKKIDGYFLDEIYYIDFSSPNMSISVVKEKFISLFNKLAFNL